MNKSFIFLSFVLGASCGSFATYKILKKKYEKITQEEIDSVKEMYRDTKDHDEEKQEESNVKESSEEKHPIKQHIESINNHRKMVKELNYGDGSEEGLGHCVISPEEFGEDENYDQINLTYYTGGILSILADENDEEVEDIEGTVGIASLETFGEYENDSVHVRNDKLKAYYEILRDERDYEDVK